MLKAYKRRIRCVASLFFFFNDTATTEIYTLSLHDALPISYFDRQQLGPAATQSPRLIQLPPGEKQVGVNSVDRKSTRLNSSHGYISYAVFCLKKKKPQVMTYRPVLLCLTVHLPPPERVTLV